MAVVKQMKLKAIKIFYNGIYQIAYKFKKNKKIIVVLATQREKEMGANLAQLKTDLEKSVFDLEIKEITYRKENTFLGKLDYFLHGVTSTYWLGKADKFFIDDYFFPVYCINKQSGTTVVQLWHALGTFKKFGHALTYKKHEVIKPHVNYDYVFINNEKDRYAYQQAFLVPKEKIHPVGMSIANHLQNELLAQNADQPAKIILYAPTYRGTNPILAINYINEFIENFKTPQNYKLVISLHPYISKKDLKVKEHITFIFNSRETDALLPKVAILITDYSSIIYNFSFWKRPILFYAPDYLTYKKNNGLFIDWIEKSGQVNSSEKISRLNSQLRELEKLNFTFIQELAECSKPVYKENNQAIIKSVFND